MLFKFSFLHPHDIALCALALVALLGLLYLTRLFPILLGRPGKL